MIQWAIVKRAFRELFRVKSTLISMVIIPIMFTFVFGVVPNIASKTTPIAVVDNDHSAVSQGYIRALDHDPGYTVKVIPGKDAIPTLRNMDAAAVITLPHGLQARALANQPMSFNIMPSANTGGAASGIAFVQGLQDELSAMSITGSVAMQSARASGTSGQQLVAAFVKGLSHHQDIRATQTAEEHALTSRGEEYRSITPGQQSLVGFATMFIVFETFAAIGSIFVEKASGTWARLSCSPATKSALLTGFGLRFFLLGWLQFLILALAGRWLFGIHIPLNGWMALVISLFILAVTGIALCIGGLVKTIEQHMTTGSFIAIATSMIGGAYWPKDIEPTWMQHVAWFVPQNWAMDAMKLVVLGHPTFDMLLWPLVVLASFAVVFFSVGMLQLRYS